MSFHHPFLRSSRKSNEFCHGAASVISRLEIFEVSIVGKHIFLDQNKSGNHAIEHKVAFDIPSFGRLLGDRDQYCYFGMAIFSMIILC